MASSTFRGDASKLRLRLLVALGIAGGAALNDAARAEDPETIRLHQTVAATCPSEETALDRLQALHPEDCPPVILNAPNGDTDGCCYEVTYDCSAMSVGCNFIGRPLLVEGRPLAGTTLRGPGWQDARTQPDRRCLSPSDRRLLAKHWIRVGAAEYASVAGFNRFSMDLMANGAPRALIAAALRAASDEMRHAHAAFSMASAFAGSPVGPGALGFPEAVPVNRTISQLAVATVQEGCTIETLSTCLLRMALGVASDAATRKVLRMMVRDEERHCELAWRTLRWAIEAEPTIAAAVSRAFVDAIAELDVRNFASAGSAAHGMLSPALARRCRDETVELIIEPCAEALLRSKVADDSAHA